MAQSRGADVVSAVRAFKGKSVAGWKEAQANTADGQSKPDARQKVYATYDAVL